MLSFVLTLALAAPTFVVNHVGRLLDQNDRPVAGPVDLKFALHTSPIVNASDETVWTDDFPEVAVDAAGTYEVTLGDTSAASGSGHHALTPDLFSDNRWLEISVDGVPLQPWLQIGATAYAIHASGADTVGGLSATSTPTAGALLALDANARFPTSVLPTATSSADGLLSHQDFASFEGKLDHVVTGAGLTGDGTSTNPLAVAQLGVKADAPLTGDGTDARHLGLALATGEGLTGSGTSTNPLALAMKTGAGLSGDGATSPLALAMKTGAGLTGDGATSPLALAMTTGEGLTGSGTSASPLAVSFAGSGSANTAARSDHTHPNYVEKGAAIDAPTMTLAPTTAPTCNSAAAGTMYFDQSKKRFYGCDGASWNEFVAAPAPGGPNVVRLGDVLLEWGVATVDTAGQTNLDAGVVTFPQPFTQTPSVEFHVADTGPWQSEPTITSCGVTTTGACLQLASHTYGTPYATAMGRNGDPVYWIAIGR